jgi:hypothetical protein
MEIFIKEKLADADQTKTKLMCIEALSASF